MFHSSDLRTSITFIKDFIKSNKKLIEILSNAENITEEEKQKQDAIPTLKMDFDETANAILTNIGILLNEDKRGPLAIMKQKEVISPTIMKAIRNNQQISYREPELSLSIKYIHDVYTIIEQLKKELEDAKENNTVTRLINPSGDRTTDLAKGVKGSLEHINDNLNKSIVFLESKLRESQSNPVNTSNPVQLKNYKKRLMGIMGVGVPPGGQQSTATATSLTQNRVVKPRLPTIEETNENNNNSNNNTSTTTNIHRNPTAPTPPYYFKITRGPNIITYKSNEFPTKGTTIPVYELAIEGGHGPAWMDNGSITIPKDDSEGILEMLDCSRMKGGARKSRRCQRGQKRRQTRKQRK
jgi:hypothetical protein